MWIPISEGIKASLGEMLLTLTRLMFFLPQMYFFHSEGSEMYCLPDLTSLSNMVESSPVTTWMSFRTLTQEPAWKGSSSLALSSMEEMMLLHSGCSLSRERISPSNSSVTFSTRLLGP